MAKPNGYSTTASDAVTLDEDFNITLDTPDQTFFSTFISVSTTAGVIVYINPNGQTMTDYGFVGRNPIAATRILTEGTTAVGLYFSGSYGEG